MTSTESLVNCLRELKNAKVCLDKKHTSVQHERNRINSLLETDTQALSQIKDRHTKMLDTSYVAQHKAAQTQAQFNSLEKMNQGKKKSLETIEEQLKQEESGQQKDLRIFEDDLAKLSSLLNKARENHSDSTLEARIAEVEQCIRQYQHQVPDIEAGLEGQLTYIDQCIEQLMTQCPASDVDIDRAAVWDLFAAEEEMYESILSKCCSPDEETQALHGLTCLTIDR